MYKLNLNIPLSIFLTGTILFLLAPVLIFDSYSTHEIFMTGIVIQLTGITASLIEFFRYKITEKLIKEI
ncbi:MAG: hypothetical protein HND53_12070 [Proteobacteria bacterium]|nr:hypothetical protein [Pseudomonadota bacterium]NOG61230.1 hypothetical protein [Pseudomonadota bacterium]